MIILSLLLLFKFKDILEISRRIITKKKNFFFNNYNIIFLFYNNLIKK